MRTAPRASRRSPDSLYPRTDLWTSYALQGSRKAAALVALGAVVLVSALTLPPGDAHAAFPGENGRIAYVDRVSGDAAILTILPDGSDRTPIRSGPFSQPSWSSDGSRIVFMDSRVVFTMTADGEQLTQVIGPFESDVSPSFSPDRRRILYTDGFSIRTIERDGTHPRRVAVARKRGSYYDYARYSPDGRRILFVGQPDGKRKGGIWTMRADGARVRRLTSNLNDSMPDYSPDGRHIVFVRFEGQRQLRVMRSDGSNQRTIIQDEPIVGSVFSPAGDRIAFAMAPGPAFPGCSDIYTASRKGGEIQRVTDGCDPLGLGPNAGEPTWQPFPPPPSSQFQITKVKRDRRNGTAKLQLEVPGTGKVRLNGTKQVKAASRRMPVAGPVTLPIQPRGKAKRRLRKQGAATIRAKVTYNPSGAEPSTKSKRIKLKRQR